MVFKIECWVVSIFCKKLSKIGVVFTRFKLLLKFQIDVLEKYIAVNRAVKKPV